MRSALILCKLASLSQLTIVLPCRIVVFALQQFHTDGDASNAGNADQIAQIEKLPAAEKIAVDLVKYLPDELVINVRCPTEGWLLVTDRWARSWRAEVNGDPVAVYGGNFIFRAVKVSAGSNNIRFTYRPFGFP